VTQSTFSSSCDSGDEELPKVPLPLRTRLGLPLVEAHVSDFVIVKMMNDVASCSHRPQRPLFLVGSVVERTDSLLEIHRMKRHGSKLGQFVYTAEAEINFYPPSSVICILDNPKMVNRVHHFADDFTLFASRLR
jgi:hypothetical protein